MKKPAKPARRANVAGHTYDTTSRTLTVHFAHSGRTYKYSDVSPERALQFGDAESPGSYLHKHIIPHHDATEIT